MTVKKEKWYSMDSCKLLWHMPRVMEYLDKGKRVYPLHVDMAITKRCNAKCVYCYGIYQKINRDMMPERCVMDVMGTVHSLGVKSMTLTGDGENTLNPALYPGLILGKHTGLDIGLATNGILLDEDKLHTVLSSCVWLRFNLSACDNDSYSDIHGVRAWPSVESNIKKAVALNRKHSYGCTIGLQVVLIPQVLKYLVREAQFAVDSGVDYMVVKQFSDPGCSEMSQFNLEWYDKPDVIELLKAVEAMSTEHTKIVVKWNMMHMKGRREYDHCVDCAFLFQISGNSRCYPCGYLFNNETYCYGDLTQKTFREIIDSDQYWAVVEHMRHKFDVHKDCQGACRHDFTNKFVWDYLHPPEHINFI